MNDETGSGKERRAHVRRPTNLTVQGTPDQGGVVARMQARNLSLGGLYCTASQDFPEMTRLAVRLMLPVSPEKASTEPVDVEAVVVRRERIPDSSVGHRRFEYGLFFTNLEADARSRIENYLAQ